MAPAVAVEDRLAELDEVFLVLSLLPGFVAIIEVVWCFGSGISASFCVGHRCCSLHIRLHSHVLQRVLIVFLASFQSFPPPYWILLSSLAYLKRLKARLISFSVPSV